MFVNWIRKVVSLNSGKKKNKKKCVLRKEKDVVRLVTSVVQRKIQSVHEDWDLRPSDSALLCSTTEPPRLHQGWSPLRSSYLTRVLHTARISVVNSLMFVNRIRKMVCFDLGKENMKRIFRENMRGDSMKNRTSDLRIPRCDTPILYRVIWELRNLHCSPQSHCGSVVEHRSAKSEGLRLDSSWEIIIFFFVPRRKTVFPTSVMLVHDCHWTIGSAHPTRLCDSPSMITFFFSHYE